MEGEELWAAWDNRTISIERFSWYYRYRLFHQSIDSAERVVEMFIAILLFLWIVGTFCVYAFCAISGQAEQETDVIRLREEREDQEIAQLQSLGITGVDSAHLNGLLGRKSATA